ncbi:carbon-nitrogen hydrolase family protein [Pseudoroseicyclus tamaricis]|uniref:Carbon-nitrogen hydrolase family protein n=1 Tax=Pseudoroseicyclus tamaricis TaxID=2705421 RepID=A0A6B2JWV3_9RHOB|nr:carbon-nitrogen hydrolase family protein [Pseudoroseicyclus tamaricis]NDV02698.1 carbon-nitrogen hydrolase family protein [Pseudoroseicyclus tamaricis]
MRAALCQMCSSDDPGENLAAARAMIAEAAAGGAQLVCTPEVTNCVSTSRTQQEEVLRLEEDDPVLAGLREAAREAGVWLAIGSLALKTRDADGRFANRSFLISPEGEIAARYDKIHMFDVQVSETETYRESAGYRPGGQAVVAQTPLATLGLTICYDVRFPHLHRALGKAGAEVLLVPSAFSPGTGPGHWEVLLRARAIETGAFVLAAAQTGEHSLSQGRPRRSYGHSLAVAPWGEVLLDAGEEAGVFLVDLDLGKVAEARGRLPALSHDRGFDGP